MSNLAPYLLLGVAIGLAMNYTITRLIRRRSK
jgi:hypothetical protein